VKKNKREMEKIAAYAARQNKVDCRGSSAQTKKRKRRCEKKNARGKQRERTMDQSNNTTKNSRKKDRKYGIGGGEGGPDKGRMNPAASTGGVFVQG